MVAMQPGLGIVKYEQDFRKGMGATSLCVPSFQPRDYLASIGREQDLESEVPVQAIDLDDFG